MENSSSAQALPHSLPQVLPEDFQKDNRIAILDFGSQVTQLIARRLRQAGIYSHIFPYNPDALEQLFERLESFAPRGIVLSGGPKSLLEEKTPIDKRLFALGRPLLGICYGEQILCQGLGGRLERAQDSEYGPAQLEIVEDCLLFDKDEDKDEKAVWRAGARVSVWMSHTDKIASLPKGFRAVAHTEKAPYAIIANDARGFYGLQFHPEVSHTEAGERLLANFAHKVCHCTGAWQAQEAIAQAVEGIRLQVGEGRVLCAISGGVDSTVAALLIQRAIGERLHVVFLDNGLLREGEAVEVEDSLRPYFGKNLLCVDESERFLQALRGISDPEKKRKTIGNLFVRCFEDIAQQLEKSHGKIAFLGQGTLYPDVVESLPTRDASQSRRIKSHHNVGGLPERMTMRLVEPLRFLFKDEVREIGRTLGVAQHFLARHPFPGPGLAVRLPGEVTKERCEILRRIDQVFLRALRREGLYDAIWQAFAVLLPITSVGVMGDARSVQACCVLRAVVSEDGMTARPYPFTPDFQARVAAEIVNEVQGVNRVLYDCTGKPPATIEWE